MALETLLVERDGPVAIVTLNRPKALNALSQALLAELSGVVAAIAADDEVRAVVILGAGDRAFAAGAAALLGAAASWFAAGAGGRVRDGELTPHALWDWRKAVRRS